MVPGLASKSSPNVLNVWHNSHFDFETYQRKYQRVSSIELARLGGVPVRLHY